MGDGTKSRCLGLAFALVLAGGVCATPATAKTSCDVDARLASMLRELVGVELPTGPVATAVDLVRTVEDAAGLAGAVSSSIGDPAGCREEVVPGRTTTTAPAETTEAPSTVGRAAAPSATSTATSAPLGAPTEVALPVQPRAASFGDLPALPEDGRFLVIPFGLAMLIRAALVYRRRTAPS